MSVLNKSKPRKLGLDFGNTIVPVEVLASKHPKGRFRDFNYDELKQAEAYHRAIPVIMGLRSLFDDVYIISKCTAESEGNISLWLAIHKVTGDDLIPQNHVRFCRERADKAPICRMLGITDFIDDRVEVLTPMDTVPYRYRFGNRDNEPEGFQEIPKGIVHVQTWDEVLEKIVATL